MTPKILAAVLETSGYIVGDSNARSGLYMRDVGDDWTRAGWPNIRAFGLASSPSALYMAAGNGVLKSLDNGNSWKVVTDWRTTEVLDVVISPDNQNMILAASAHGIWRSSDAGNNWMLCHDVDETRYSQSIAFDARNGMVAFAATENGILRSTDSGLTWDAVSGTTRSAAIRKIVQNTDYPSIWWAATANHGILRSIDNGERWEQAPGPFNSPLYSVGVMNNIVATTGYHTGPLVSRDEGQNWKSYPFPNPVLSGHALLFDSRDSNKLLVGTTTDGVFELNLSSGAWSDAGLPDATIRGLYTS